MSQTCITFQKQYKISRTEMIPLHTNLNKIIKKKKVITDLQTKTVMYVQNKL